ncbi:hypothetical protein TWF506_003958 [Arthrobotrys conoides]|uniref:DUF7770 domain-containing protein n=1 Tax=Arthrobotrys conoides TaxID=74498 RepID=A0AAN8RTQ0_9PEZI
MFQVDFVKEIDSIKLVAQAPESEDTRDPLRTNHFFLRLTNNSDTIASLDMEVDAVKGGTDREGKVILHSEYIIATVDNGDGDDDDDRVVKEFKYPVITPGLSTRGIVDIMVRNRRDRYDFNDNGEGCTYWCEAILGDLAREGYRSHGVLLV